MSPTTGSPTITMLRLSSNHCQINMTYCYKKAYVINFKNKIKNKKKYSHQRLPKIALLPPDGQFVRGHN